MKTNFFHPKFRGEKARTCCENNVDTTLRRRVGIDT